MEETERNITLAELGALLRERRLKKGLTEDAVASQLKITSRLVMAIEAGDMEALPHAVYARGFIRAYAKALGVDESVVREACSFLKDPEEELREQENLAAPDVTPVQGVSIPWFAIAIGLLFLAGGAWYFRGALGLFSEKEAAVLQEDVRVAASVAAPAVPTPPPAATVPSVTGPTAPVSEAPVMLGGTLVPSETEAPAEKPVLPAEGHRIVLTGTADCWMSITTDGKNSQRILHAGESVTVDFQNTFVMKLGNAGGIQVNYDGKDLAPVGKPGQVKTVRFPQDAEKY